MLYKEAILGYGPRYLFPLFLGPSAVLLGITYYSSLFPRPFPVKEISLPPPESDFPPPQLKLIYEIAKLRLKEKEEERKGEKKEAAVKKGMINSAIWTIGALLTIPHIRTNMYSLAGNINQELLKLERKEEEQKEYYSLLQLATIKKLLNQGMPEIAWASLSDEEKERVISLLESYGFEKEDIQPIIKDWEKQIKEMEKVVQEAIKKRKVQVKKTASMVPWLIIPPAYLTTLLTGKALGHLTSVSEPYLGVRLPSEVALSQVRKLPEIKDLEAQYMDPSDIFINRLQKNVTELLLTVDTIQELKEELERKKRKEQSKVEKEKIDLEIKKLEAKERETKRLLSSLFDRPPTKGELIENRILAEIEKEKKEEEKKKKLTEEQTQSTTRKRRPRSSTELAELFVR